MNVMMSCRTTEADHGRDSTGCPVGSHSNGETGDSAPKSSGCPC